MTTNSTEKSSEKEVLHYDLIIVGGGPAGLTAGLYASRAKMNVVLLERGFAGGQVATTGTVDNYPGVRNISGMELAQMMEEQAKEFGLDIRICDVKCLEPQEEGGFCLETSCTKYLAPAVILTTGVQPRKLGVPGEREYKGKGVSYCAICDGFFYNDKHVAVIGGGDSAVEEGIYLTKYAEKVTIIHRRGELRAQKILQQEAFDNPKVEFLWDTVVREIGADNDGFVNNLVLEHKKSGKAYDFPVDGVFIYVGTEPNIFMCELNGLKRDDMGFVITDNEMRTSLPGLFAAGDLRSKFLRQIVTAVSDGAVAAISAERYLQELKHKRKAKDSKQEAKT